VILGFKGRSWPRPTASDPVSFSLSSFLLYEILDLLSLMLLQYSLDLCNCGHLFIFPV
jgi:hypothetical protein